MRPILAGRRLQNQVSRFSTMAGELIQSVRHPGKEFRMSQTPLPVISIEHLSGAVTVHVLARELGKSEVDAICSGIDAEQPAAPLLPFILDLANVSFMGSLAMGVIMGLFKEFQT